MANISDIKNYVENDGFNFYNLSSSFIDQNTLQNLIEQSKFLTNITKKALIK